MRVFYLFQIKEEQIKRFKMSPKELYEQFESIYLLNSEDLILGYNLFSEVALPIEKENINHLIKSLNKDNINYITYNYTHVVNDYYSDENTKLIVNNTHIKIKSNKNIPCFLDVIRGRKNIFVCDFINNDYFFLSEIMQVS